MTILDSEKLEEAIAADVEFEGLPTAEELPSVRPVGAAMAQVWGGLIGFIQQTMKLYDQSDWTEEQKAEHRYKWMQREAVDTSEREERELRLQYAQKYGEELGKQEAFREDQRAHMARWEALESERTDRLVEVQRKLAGALCDIERERTGRLVDAVTKGFEKVIAVFTAKLASGPRDSQSKDQF